MSVTETSPFSKSLAALRNGAVIMAAQALPVTALNRVSVVCCHDDLPARKACQKIFSGQVDHSTPSMRHFGKGLTGHLVKESSRLLYKVGGLALLKPRLEREFQATSTPYGTLKASLVFSGALACAEITINPADTWRTVLQSGKTIKASLKPGQSALAHLYAGSAANGIRQFGTWWIFSMTESVCNKIVKKTTDLDPHALPGMIAKSWPQAAILTSGVYLFERVKNELQYRPFLREEANKTKDSCYAVAIKHIQKTQGYRGFMRGFAAKTWSNAILVFGANLLLEQGRRDLKSTNP
ncbi:MAG: hypothetical protein KGZ39_00805 [Simkania sp.]|nr:hypothetical protein [Simkania sp.]